jgi:hypothetical protein
MYLFVERRSGAAECDIGKEFMSQRVSFPVTAGLIIGTGESSAVYLSVTTPKHI